ncbi:MAG: hypothetical protein H6661_07220 [Ardenticatenaceae bacterium]|nr:hypothetical protein [Ardenticatenaceae bacterium]
MTYRPGGYDQQSAAAGVRRAALERVLPICWNDAGNLLAGDDGLWVDVYSLQRATASRSTIS